MYEKTYKGFVELMLQKEALKQSFDNNYVQIKIDTHEEAIELRHHLQHLKTQAGALGALLGKV